MTTCKKKSYPFKLLSQLSVCLFLFLFTHLFHLGFSLVTLYPAVQPFLPESGPLPGAGQLWPGQIGKCKQGPSSHKGQVCGTFSPFYVLKEQMINLRYCHFQFVVIAQWLAWRLATGEVSGSNSGKGDNLLISD